MESDLVPDSSPADCCCGDGGEQFEFALRQGDFSDAR